MARRDIDSDVLDPASEDDSDDLDTEDPDTEDPDEDRELDDSELDDDDTDAELEADSELEDDDDDDDDSDESLDAVLSQESPRRSHLPDDPDDPDEIDFADQPDPITAELRTRAEPVKDAQEFVCARCHLVKSRSQLADTERRLCRDCV